MEVEDKACLKEVCAETKRAYLSIDVSGISIAV